MSKFVSTNIMEAPILIMLNKISAALMGVRSNNSEKDLDFLVFEIPKKARSAVRTAHSPLIILDIFS